MHLRMQAVTNFSSSFADGLAFCAIVHRFRPALLPAPAAGFASLSRLERFTLAFEVELPWLPT